MNRYIETVITGKGTRGPDDLFPTERNQCVSKEPTWTLTMVPNVEHTLIIIDEEDERASKTNKL